MKRISTLILIAVGGSAGVLLGALATVDKSKYKNDFVRLFPPHAADVTAVISIPEMPSYLIGMVGDHIYAGGREDILKISISSKDTSRIKLGLPFGSHVTVYPPYFFVYNGSTGFLSRGTISSWLVDTTFQSIPRFTAIRMISPNNAILQMINVDERQSLITGLKSVKKHVLKKQLDGILCTDGVLQYSQKLKQAVYTFRYRNRFICLDTNLNIVRYGKTIDTTSVAKIAVSELNGQITMARPPLSVNTDAYVDGKYLFVQSNLVARNEQPDQTKDKTVFDVYNLVDGSYLYSFYIGNHNGSKVQGFLVNDNTLVALFKTAVVAHRLPSKYLP